jgi:hypothetical protein
MSLYGVVSAIKVDFVVSRPLSDRQRVSEARKNLSFPLQNTAFIFDWCICDSGGVLLPVGEISPTPLIILP